ncbi:MAG: DNA topoisomerase IB [Sphingomonadaceae bacterium]|nr:DNA topoisomerase IB [Sphingomonadaceae bacterium]
MDAAALIDSAEDGTLAGGPQQAAEDAGLIYVRDDVPGITRRRSGKGWAYRAPDGRPIRNRDEIARLNSLAIPPAYTDVWICPTPNGHIQATGRDARGRKQYGYHSKFRETREETKFEHMLAFARALPTIRKRIDRDMALRGLRREKVLATIVYLLETTLIRVGNDEYAKDNKSFGLTTLRNRHVRIEGSELRFRFKGKSGKEWNLKLRDRRVARIVKAAQELPGQSLFQYLDEGGARREVSSGDVNAYLKEISGRDITAKDFRTWGGTVLAALTLAEMEEGETERAAKKNLTAAIKCVATQLGNTPAVCRKSYIHPAVLASYMARELRLGTGDGAADAAAETAADAIAEGLRAEEQAVLRFLEGRLAQAAQELDKRRDLRGTLERSAAAA